MASQDGFSSQYLVSPTPKAQLGDYWLDPPFAQGSYGTICYALNTVTGDQVVVKRITTRDSAAEVVLRNEVKILRGTDHPNICSLVEFINPAPFSFRRPASTGAPLHPLRESYLIIKPAARDCLDQAIVDLKAILPFEAPVSLDRTALRRPFTCQLIVQIANACAYLHQRGIMHRDLNPENIALQVSCQEAADSSSTTMSFAFYLLDFGHAEYVTHSLDHRKGTIRYLAPEVLELKYHSNHNVQYTNAVDIWALGICCLEVIQKCRIRDDKHAVQAAKAFQVGARRLDEANDAMKGVVARMLDADAEKRITAEAIVDEMRQARLDL